MKKIVLFICLISVIMMEPGTVWGASRSVEFKIGGNIYQINGNVVEMDAVPFALSGRTYIPVRVLADSLGISVAWNNDMQRIELSGDRDNTIIVLYEGDNKIYREGVQGVNQPVELVTSMDVAAINKDGRIYLPARYLAGIYDWQVKWDSVTNSVIIEKLVAKETYPFEVSLLFPEGYIQNDVEIPLQLLIRPDQDGEYALLGFECYDGIEVDLAKSIELRDMLENRPRIINFEANMQGTNSGKIDCLIDVFNKQNEKIYSIKRELFVISTDDGQLCSSNDDYGGLILRHINKLRYEGRISGYEYERIRKGVMRGGEVTEYLEEI